MMEPKYSTLAYPHTYHLRFVRGCEECLQRTKAAQRRYTESRRRIREHNRRHDRICGVCSGSNVQGSQTCHWCGAVFMEATDGH